MVVVFHRIAVWQTYSCVESMHAEWGQHHEDMQDRSPVKGEASVKGPIERKVGHTKKFMKIRHQVSQEVAPTNQTKLEDKLVIFFAHTSTCENTDNCKASRVCSM